jgi:hypothetical protein
MGLLEIDDILQAALLILDIMFWSISGRPSEKATGWTLTEKAFKAGNFGKRTGRAFMIGLPVRQMKFQ